MSIASSTWTNLAQISLTQGYWILEAKINYSPNSNGSRNLSCSTTSTPSQGARNSYIGVRASDLIDTGIMNMQILYASSDIIYYLHGIQNSGTTLTAYPFLKAIKILS